MLHLIQVPRPREIRCDGGRARDPSGRMPLTRAPTDNLREGGTAVQSRRHGEWAHGDHTGLKLTVETSIFVLLAGGWLWGVLALGAHATATQGPTSHGGGLSGRGGLSCPAPPHRAGEGVGGETGR